VIEGVIPPMERIRLCRLLAADARHEAAKATDPALRESYSIIGERWEDMARDVEGLLARGESPSG
jgi:hypothetical protein